MSPSWRRISWRFPASSCHTNLEGWEVNGPDKRQEGAEPWHLQQFRHHCAPEHMVVRSNSVDGEECRIRVPLRHDSSGPSGQRELEWSTRCFDLLAELLRQGLGDQPTERGACGDASHATVLLLQGRQSRQSETVAHTTRNIPSGKIVGCTIQQLTRFLVIQTHLQYFVRASSPAWGRPRWRTSQTIGEQLEIQLQWRWWGEIQHLSWYLTSRHLWTSFTELPQSLLVFGSQRRTDQFLSGS